MNRKHYPSPQRRNCRHLALVLLLFGLMATGMVQAANQALAQTKVTAHFKQATLHEVLWEIQKQTGFTFIYNTTDVEGVQSTNWMPKSCPSAVCSTNAWHTATWSGRSTRESSPYGSAVRYTPLRHSNNSN